MFSDNDVSIDKPGNGAPLVASGAWIDAARVANLAEAGFIVDELIGLGFQARVHQMDEFSAATDRWSAQYLIRVPEEFGTAAADHIRQYLSEEPLGKRTMFQRLHESIVNAPPDQTYSWRLVVIVLLVGVTSFLLGHQYSEQTPRRTKSTDLTAALSDVGQVFSSESAANQPSYRLSFDVRRQLWKLSADRDHDGVYESTRQFTSAGGAH